jgi:hypothetical protein
MGTTMTVAILQSDGKIAIGHVGDSRAYRLRDARLEQLTDDHSLVAELVRRGELSPEEARVHPQRSVITRALGTEADVDVDSFTVETMDGDVFLLCSDGLTTMVDAETIEQILVRYRSNLDKAASALIKAANDRGGDDNITAILFDVAEGDPDPDQELAAPAPAYDPDDEDTLHPEDNVRLPDLEDAPPAEVTMVVSAADLAKALAASDGTDAGDKTDAGDAETVPLPAVSEAAVSDPAAAGAAPAESSVEPGTSEPGTSEPATSEPAAPVPTTESGWPATPPAVAAHEWPPGQSAAPESTPEPEPADGAGATESTAPDTQPAAAPRSWLDGDPAEDRAAEETPEPEEKVSIARLALALLVIAALATAIVLLVLDALPR